MALLRKNSLVLSLLVLTAFTCYATVTEARVGGGAEVLNDNQAEAAVTEGKWPLPAELNCYYVGESCQTQAQCASMCAEAGFLAVRIYCDSRAALGKGTCQCCIKDRA